MTSEKPEWFELSEGDAIAPATRAKSKKLPFVAAAAVGVVILAGSLFANANDEPNADASTTTISATASPNASSSTQASPSASSTGAPTIAAVPQGNGGHGDDGHSDDGFGDDGDNRGPRPDGDHRDGFKPDGDHHRD
ncbi:MAG: hypothetical protein KGM39_04950 [Actinomycetales bacterium]|nr:hypothetical protein [Actinomycetales bacterium]